jgi:hypothetical protein
LAHTEHPQSWPSVTTVLSVIAKQGLYRWYAKHGWDECERIKTEAGAIGTRVHDAIERLLKGETVEESGRVHSMLLTFEKWRYSANYQPLELERKVESKLHKFHGTLDSIGTMNDTDELVLTDWKSSSQIDTTYALQLAAYAWAYEEETGKTITTGQIVRLDKKPDAKPQIEVKRFDNLPSYFPVFLSCLNLWNFLHPNKKRGRK